MQLRAIHRLAMLLTLSVLLLLGVSGFAVSAATGLSAPAWALAGKTFHRVLAGTVSAFAVALFVQCLRAKCPPWLTRGSFAALVVILAQAFIGMNLSRLGEMPWTSVLQAMLSHGLVMLSFLLYFASSREFAQEAETVEDELQPPLRSLAWLPAILVVAQILLGSAYRHGIMGVIPHLSLAFVTAGALAFLAILVATTYPGRRDLKRVAFTVAWFTAAQIVLGLIALFYRLQTSSAGAAGGPESWWVLFTVGHVLLGSVTLAAAVWMAIEIRKYVRPHAPLSESLVPRPESVALETKLR